MRDFTRTEVDFKTTKMPPPSTIPAPKQVKNPYGNRKTFGSAFHTGVVLELGKRHLRENVIVLPVAFQKECRKVMMSHIPDLQTWFHTSPSRETLERLIDTPAEFPISVSMTNTILRALSSTTFLLTMTGILLEDTRILPDLSVSEKPVIQEVTDIPVETLEPMILRKSLRNTDDEDEDGDEAGNEDDELGENSGDDELGEDEDDYDLAEDSEDSGQDDGSVNDASSVGSTGTVSRALERIQNRLDRVREDLEDLRRLKSKRKHF